MDGRRKYGKSNGDPHLKNSGPDSYNEAHDVHPPELLATISKGSHAVGSFALTAIYAMIAQVERATRTDYWVTMARFNARQAASGFTL